MRQMPSPRGLLSSLTSWTIQVRSPIPIVRMLLPSPCARAGPCGDQLCLGMCEAQKADQRSSRSGEHASCKGLLLSTGKGASGAGQ